MNLSSYNISDLNMYLSNTFINLNSKPSYITSIEALDSDGDFIEDSNYPIEVIRVNVQYMSGSGLDSEVVEFPYSDNLPTIPVQLGYRSFENHVVYLYHVQGRNYKKLPTFDSIRSFNPQSNELERLNSRVKYPDNSDIRELLLKPPVYLSLEEAYTKLQDKSIYALPLHKNYALVKKGKYADPVIYYRTDPVLTYNGSELTALIDNCHINKFLLEVPQ